MTVGRGRPIALHQGYLKKRGTKFKLWTPRWFVLEANTHKLVYYENEMDSTCRGSIDLTELEGVDALNSGSKAILEVCFFYCLFIIFLQLKTTTRTLSLMAESKADACSWKEKIEQVLRE